MRLLADENFHGDVLRGLLRAEPDWTLYALRKPTFIRPMTRWFWNGRQRKIASC